MLSIDSDLHIYMHTNAYTPTHIHRHTKKNLWKKSASVLNLYRLFQCDYSINNIGKNPFHSTWVTLNISYLEMIDSGQDICRSCTDLVLFYIRNLTTDFGIFGKEESCRYWEIIHLYSLFICPCMPVHKLLGRIVFTCSGIWKYMRNQAFGIFYTDSKV